MRVKKITLSEIVPGDIVYLAAGDMIPADVRILTSKDLFISQSALTGESEPVEKCNTPGKSVDNPLELSNLAKGAVALAKKKTVVKNLSSIQNFGAMDILCTDKTGTITQDNENCPNSQGE